MPEFDERLIQQQLSRGLANVDIEKSYIDKLLSKQEIERIRELTKKSPLSRSELLELLYMCASSESKLLNLGEWDRYIILKFFIWIREYIKISEIMFDFQDDLSKKEAEKKIVISDRCKKILENNGRLMEHNAKFLIDLYFNIVRTTLSLGATGFLELLKSKFELSYPQASGITGGEIEKPSIWGLKKK